MLINEFIVIVIDMRSLKWFYLTYVSTLSQISEDLRGIRVQYPFFLFGKSIHYAKITLYKNFVSNVSFKH